MAACSDLATRYNDQSVLENHHIAIALSILHTEAFSVLEGLSDPDFDHVRRVLIESILATDMARHADIMAQFVKVRFRVGARWLLLLVVEVVVGVVVVVISMNIITSIIILIVLVFI